MRFQDVQLSRRGPLLLAVTHAPTPLQVAAAQPGLAIKLAATLSSLTARSLPAVSVTGSPPRSASLQHSFSLPGPLPALHPSHAWGDTGGTALLRPSASAPPLVAPASGVPQLLAAPSFVPTSSAWQLRACAATTGGTAALPFGWAAPQQRGQQLLPTAALHSAAAPWAAAATASGQGGCCQPASRSSFWPHPQQAGNQMDPGSSNPTLNPFQLACQGGQGPAPAFTAPPASIPQTSALPVPPPRTAGAALPAAPGRAQVCATYPAGGPAALAGALCRDDLVTLAVLIQAQRRFEQMVQLPAVASREASPYAVCS